ncbi:MAG: hypothetical protein ABIZ18_05425 [Caldimonas sp.]
MRFAFATSTAALVLAAGSLAACASVEYHYSQISGQRFHVSPIDTYPVSIVKIDGRSTILHPTPVDPGLRQIVVQGPPDGVSREGRQREIALDVKPCTRYYLVAVKANRLSSDFDVKVDYQEPIGGCTPPPPAKS